MEICTWNDSSDTFSSCPPQLYPLNFYLFFKDIASAPSPRTPHSASPPHRHCLITAAIRHFLILNPPCIILILVIYVH